MSDRRSSDALPSPTPPVSDATPWTGGWRGRWIWDREPDEEGFWWKTTEGQSHFVYLRHAFEVDHAPSSVPARVTCDSRYLLFLNGQQLGRGPIRGEPEFLGWDDYDLAPHLAPGRNVIVALCHYYGSAGPWWVPAAALGTLGRGSFCFETLGGCPVDIATDTDWRAVPAPWIPNNWRSVHAFPPEVIDGRLAPDGVHDPAAHDEQWPRAVVVAGHGHGTVLDRPPAAPYMSPLRRPIPQLTSVVLTPERLVEGERPVDVEMLDDPTKAWWTARTDAQADRRLSVWDMGRLCLGHVRLTVRAPNGSAEGAVVDVVAGEDLTDDGLPEIRPRSWAARYIVGHHASERVAFFDPVGLRYLAAHYPAGLEVGVEVEETVYPRAEGAYFDCDDPRYAHLWRAGARTVDMCSTDAFLDCPGREQRAWIADAYVQILVSLVTNPDRRLVHHHLELTARSRHPSGLLAGAAACDFARAGLTTPEYSLHWLRALYAYWQYSGDEAFVQAMLPTANGIIERYERQRGASGLLEDFPGWVFLDWAQVDRDVVTGAHDALYAAALQAYAALPGASDVRALIDHTRTSFELLWDEERHAYVDAIGPRGRGRRISQHTNAAALLAGIVPEPRVDRLIARIVDPAASSFGGRLVVTLTAASVREQGLIPSFQYLAPEEFDDERDVVAAQPWFCRFLHEALFQHNRRDLILASLLRWDSQPEHGTFQEFWSAIPGTSSRCHGWSASPAYDLTSYVLGVRPAIAGYRQAVLDPYLGPLQRASGRVPTPFGWLGVSIDGSTLEMDVPHGMSVTLGDMEVGSGSHRAVLPRSALRSPHPGSVRTQNTRP